MRTRSQHNLHKKKVRKIVVATLALLVAAVLMPTFFTMVANVVIYPFHAVSVWVRESEDMVPVYIRDRQQLLEQQRYLEDELRIAQNNTVTEQHLLAENTRLRALLGVASESRLAAAVIARPKELPYDLLQVDQGAAAGVELGAPVYAGRDLAIGLVVHVAANYSFVQLFTAPDFKATVFISGPDIVANLEGFGGGVARVRVPQGVPLSTGNLVYLPSIEPGVFGRISYVENIPTQAEQYGYVSPEIAISELHIVSIGRVSQISRDPAEIDATIAAELAESLHITDLPLGAVSMATSSATSTNDNDSE